MDPLMEEEDGGWLEQKNRALAATPPPNRGGSVLLRDAAPQNTAELAAPTDEPLVTWDMQARRASAALPPANRGGSALLRDPAPPPMLAPPEDEQPSGADSWTGQIRRASATAPPPNRGGSALLLDKRESFDDAPRVAPDTSMDGGWADQIRRAAGPMPDMVRRTNATPYMDTPRDAPPRRMVAPLPTRKPAIESMVPPASMPKVAGKEDEPDNEPFAPLPADAPAPTVTPAAKVALGDKAPMRDRLADALAERANRNKGGGLAGILARAGEGVNAAVAHRKADYSFGDAIDAREQAWRDEPVLLAQRQMGMDDKRKAEDRQRLMDDLNRRFKESQISAQSPENQIKVITARGEQDRLTQDAKPVSVVLPPAPREEIPRKTMEMLKAESDALVNQRNRMGAGGASGGTTTGTGTAGDGIDRSIDEWNRTGTNPLGTRGDLRVRQMARIREREEAGENFDFLAAKIGGDARKSAAVATEKQAALLAGFAGTADQYGDMLVKMLDAGAVKQSDYPAVNEFKNWWSQHVASDAPRDRFIATVGALADEYAKATTGSLGNSGITDAARKTVYDRISKAQSSASLRSILEQLKAEAASGVSQRTAIALAERNGTPIAGAGAPERETRTLKDGTKVVVERGPDGKWHEVE